MNESLEDFLGKLSFALDEAAKAKAAADQAEELRKIVFSELVNQSGAKSAAAAEHEARASERYREMTTAMCEARTKANIAVAHAEGLRCRFEAYRSEAATAREQMKMR